MKLEEMALDDALAIAWAFRAGGYSSTDEMKIVDAAKKLVFDHAMAVLGAIKSEQDPEC